MLRPHRIAFVIGTRPEAIKLSPVVQAMLRGGETPLLIVTGQHPGLELSAHGLADLPAIPLHCEGLADPMIHADLVRVAMVRLLAQHDIAMVVVQGDTSSALGGALAAKELGYRLAHVEAGLRSHDPRFPWPEEHNRIEIDHVADILFAPTSGNAANLRREQVRGQVHVVGNSGIDALASIVGELPLKQRWRLLPKRKCSLLVTCHRRENWGDGLAGLAESLHQLSSDRGMAIDVVLHPNPSVAEAMVDLLSGIPTIRIVPPLSHEAMITAMRRCDLLLSDSGGLQEEAASLGVPMIVMRRRTERPESLSSGNAVLAPPNSDRLVELVRELRRDHRALERMATPAMPFGDGHAAPRIAALAVAYVDDMATLSERAHRCA